MSIDIISTQVPGLRGPTGGVTTDLTALQADVTTKAAAAGTARDQSQAASATAVSNVATVASIIVRPTAKIPAWLRAIRDSKRRLTWGVRDDGTEYANVSTRNTLTVNTLLTSVGSFLAANLKVGNVNRRSAATYSNALAASLDAKRRQFWRQGPDGTFWANLLGTGRLSASDIRSHSTGLVSADGTRIVYSRADTNGDYQIYSMLISTGQVTKLSTTPGNHREIKLVGSNVSFLTNGAYTEIVPIDGSAAPVRLISAPAIGAIGHSMLAAYSPTRYPLPNVVSDLLGQVAGPNLGVPGFNSSQVVARLGLVPATVTLTGNKIPAGASVVSITALTPVDWLMRSYQGTATYGTIAGVYGMLTWDASLGERFFPSVIQTADVAVAAGTAFVPDNRGVLSDTVIIWMLVNDDLSTSTKRNAAIANLQLVVNGLQAQGKRFVILSELNSSTEPSGSAGYTNKIALNQAVQALYPSNYIDARALLVAAYNASLPADVTAHGQDIPPPSLQESDGFHPNQLANVTVLGPAIVAFMQAKGWY